MLAGAFEIKQALHKLFVKSFSHFRNVFDVYKYNQTCDEAKKEFLRRVASSFNKSSSFQIKFVLIYLELFSHLVKPSTLLIEHDYIIFCCRTRRSKELTRYFVRHIDDRVLEDDYDIQYIVPIAAKRKHWNVINFIINQVKKQIFK